MLKKTIDYTDFNDVQRTKDFYFNLSKSELAKAEIRETIMVDEKVTGGFRAKMEAIVKSGRGRDIMDAFEDIIRMTYGIKDEDGERFVKDEKLTQDFMQTNAYDVLFFELVTDAEAASEFINAVVPPEVSAQMRENSDRDKPSRPYPTAPVKPQSLVDDVIPDPFIPDVSSVSSPSREIAPGVELTQEEIREAIRKRNQPTDGGNDGR